MKIFDITQEVFSSSVYPGDPTPKREILSKIENGEVCNLTALSMCAHNGTHIDAPYHFFSDGETVEKLALEKTVGYAYIKRHSGNIEKADAERILAEAKKANPEAARRILIGGNAVLTEAGAKVLSENSVLLFGNESQTVGPEDAPMAVHKELLSHGTVLLEGIRLDGVEDGVFFLFAAPLKLGGADGAPVRALLLSV